MWKCNHCSVVFEFSKTAEKANHSRWCSFNPKANHYRNNSALEKAVQKSKDKKYGSKKEFFVICNKCNEKFSVIEREKNFPSKEKYFCSRSCANSHTVTLEHRKKTSESLTGREYSQPREVTEVCKNCFNNFKYLIKYNKKQFCSKSCAATFTNRAKSEKLRQQRSEFDNYKLDCKFKFNIKDYPNEFDFKLIEEFGWYKAKNRGNNLNGVSRDHIISVVHGYENKIDPLLISHPANCRLVKQSENASKGKKSLLTLDELMLRITEWNKKYHAG